MGGTYFQIFFLLKKISFLSKFLNKFRVAKIVYLHIFYLLVLQFKILNLAQNDILKIWGWSHHFLLYKKIYELHKFYYTTYNYTYTLVCKIWLYIYIHFLNFSRTQFICRVWKEKIVSMLFFRIFWGNFWSKKVGIFPPPWNLIATFFSSQTLRIPNWLSELTFNVYY